MGKRERVSKCQRKAKREIAAVRELGLSNYEQRICRGRGVIRSRLGRELREGEREGCTIKK